MAREIRQKSYVVLALCGAFALDCVDTAPLTNATASIRATSAVSELDAEHDALRELTRDLALGLADQAARNKVLADMRQSTVREHKLEFRSYLLSDRGSTLLSSAAGRSGKSPGEIIALAEAVRPLEFYMPVVAHRTTWQGEPQLLVAGEIEESEVPIGFALDGFPVALSRDRPGSIPTLALVPVETDFRDAGLSPNLTRMSATDGPRLVIQPPDCDPNDCTCTGDCSPPPPPPPPRPAGMYMDKMVIRDAHEPWIRGQPELDIIFWAEIPGAYIPNGLQPTPAPGGGWDYTATFTWNPSVLSRVYASCAGENAPENVERSTVPHPMYSRSDAVRCYIT